MSNAAKFRKRAAEFESQKQVDKAIANYVRAIEAGDAEGEEVDVGVLNKVGDLALRLGRVAEAVASYERAVEHYAAVGLFNNAIALCNKILRHAPGRVGVYLTLGRVCGRKGMRGDASRNFLEYASRMQKEGRSDEAMRSLAEVASLMPELAEVRRLVEEHAARAGIALPTAAEVSAVVEADAAEQGAGLVFLDIDYDAAVDLTPPLGTSSIPPYDTASSSRNGAAKSIPPAPPTRTSSLEDLLIFDPTEFDDDADFAAPLDGFESTLTEESTPETDAAIDATSLVAADDASAHASDVQSPDGLTDALGFEPLESSAAEQTESLDGLVTDGDEQHGEAWQLEEDPVSEEAVTDPADSMSVPVLESAVLEVPSDTGEIDAAIAEDREADADEPDVSLDLLLDIDPVTEAQASSHVVEPLFETTDDEQDVVWIDFESDHLELVESSDELEVESSPASHVEDEDLAEDSAHPAAVETGDLLFDLDAIEETGAEQVEHSSGEALASDVDDDVPRAETPSTAASTITPATPSIPMATIVQETPSIPMATITPATPSIPVATIVQETPSIPMATITPATPSIPMATITPATPSIPMATIMKETPADGHAVSEYDTSLAVPRLNPHDFILPGELPPIVFPDSLLPADVLNAPVADAPSSDDRKALHDAVAFERAEAASDTVDVDAVERTPADAHSWDAADSADSLSEDAADSADTPADSSSHDDVLGEVVWLDTGEDETLHDRYAADEYDRDDADADIDLDVDDDNDDDSLLDFDLETSGELDALLTPREPAVAMNLALERCTRLREEVETHPGDWARRRRLAEALLEAGELDAGLVELTATALGLEVEGELREAARVIDDVVRVAPDEIAYHQKRVELAVRLGDRDRLRASYLDLADALVRGDMESRAESVYVRVLELDPWDDRARSALGEAAPPPPARAAAPSDDGYVNLADWLSDERTTGDTRMRVKEPTVTGDEDADFDRLLQNFREGVARTLGEDDYESHYDLGVAYKEMGLLDDAIAEFQRALRSPTHRLPAYEALGQCFIEQGSFPVAVTVLSRALHEPGLDDEQRVGVLYLLGYACEALQRRDEARSYFQRVYATDIQFRDVADRLAALDRGV